MSLNAVRHIALKAKQANGTINLSEELKLRVGISTKQECLITYDNEEAIILGISKPLEDFLDNRKLKGKNAVHLYLHLANFFPQKNQSEYAKKLVDYAVSLAALKNTIDFPIIFYLCKEKKSRYYEVTLTVEHFEDQNEPTSVFTLVNWNVKEIGKTRYLSLPKENLISPSLEMIADQVEQETYEVLIEFAKFLEERKPHLDELDIEKIAQLDKLARDFFNTVQEGIKKKLGIDTDSTVFFQIWQPTKRNANNEIIARPYSYLRASWRDGGYNKTKNLKSFQSTENGEEEKKMWEQLTQKDKPSNSRD